MAAKKRKNFNAFLLVLIVLVIAGGAWAFKSMKLQKRAADFSSYPDNSALGVTNNFYQWYTSCIAEGAEDNESAGNPLVTCYQKTTYLTSAAVKSLDSKKTSVLCGKDLDFHSIAVKTKLADASNTTIEVTNSKTGEFISEVTTNYVNQKWQISAISCSPSNQ